MMNRPKMDSYDLSTKYTMCAFIRDLEKYCNELEKALDKACELLEDCPLSMLDEELDCNNCTNDYAKCWKEWALK